MAVTLITNEEAYKFKRIEKALVPYELQGKFCWHDFCLVKTI